MKESGEETSQKVKEPHQNYQGYLLVALSYIRKGYEHESTGEKDDIYLERIPKTLDALSSTLRLMLTEEDLFSYVSRESYPFEDFIPDPSEIMERLNKYALDGARAMKIPKRGRKEYTFSILSHLENIVNLARAKKPLSEREIELFDLFVNHF